MADKTEISWTDHTFNPWWGCTKVSPACKNCYAATIAHVKAKPMGYYVPGEKSHLWGDSKPRHALSDGNWKNPFRWNRKALKDGLRHRVFCGSMCDWAEDHPKVSKIRRRLWNVIRECTSLDWLMLTKRPENIVSLLPSDWGNGWSHVWMGTTIENNDYVWRADELRKVPAAIRFVSYEPALGPLDKLDLKGLHWVIYGGESATAKKLRPDDPQWARDMKERCEKAGVSFHFKQNSATPGHHVDTLDGEVIQDYPRGRMPLVLV